MGGVNVVVVKPAGLSALVLASTTSKRTILKLSVPTFTSG